MKDIHDQIKEVIGKLEAKFPPKDLAHIEQGLLNRFEKGEPLWKSFDLSKGVVEEAYRIAYNQYNSGKYEDAKKMFMLLEFLDESDIRFRYSVAACYQMEKKYWEAIVKYTQCLALFEPSPLIYYHLADCYSHEKQPTLAAAMLQGCIRTIGDNRSYDPLKVRAEQLLENIKGQVAELETKKEKTNVVG